MRPSHYCLLQCKRCQHNAVPGPDEMSRGVGSKAAVATAAQQLLAAANSSSRLLKVEVSQAVTRAASDRPQPCREVPAQRMPVQHMLLSCSCKGAVSLAIVYSIWVSPRPIESEAAVSSTSATKVSSSSSSSAIG